MHDVGVARYHIRPDVLASAHHARDSAGLGHDLIDRRVYSEGAAKVLEQLRHAAHECARATLCEPHAALAFQGMD